MPSQSGSRSAGRSRPSSNRAACATRLARSTSTKSANTSATRPITTRIVASIWMRSPAEPWMTSDSARAAGSCITPTHPAIMAGSARSSNHSAAGNSIRVHNDRTMMRSPTSWRPTTASAHVCTTLMIAGPNRVPPTTIGHTIIIAQAESSPIVTPRIMGRQRDRAGCLSHPSRSIRHQPMARKPASPSSSSPVKTGQYELAAQVPTMAVIAAARQRTSSASQKVASGPPSPGTRARTAGSRSPHSGHRTAPGLPPQSCPQLGQGRLRCAWLCVRCAMFGSLVLNRIGELSIELPQCPSEAPCTRCLP